MSAGRELLLELQSELLEANNKGTKTISVPTRWLAVVCEMALRWYDENRVGSEL